MRASKKKVLKDISHYKLRTLLTILGIAISILGLSAINIASSQLKSSFQYTADASVQPDLEFNTSPTSAALVNILQHQPNISIVQAQVRVPTRWTTPSGHFPITLLGIMDFHNVQINRFQIVEGSLPGPGQILLESSDRAIRSIHVGDQIEVSGHGTPQRLTVSGFARTQGRLSTALLQRAQGYIRADEAQMLSSISGVNDFLLRLRNYNQRNATIQRVESIFRAQHVQVGNFYAGHDDTTSTLADGLFSTMRILSLVALLLSIFLLVGTVTTLVSEQLPIIGTMKAIGAKRGQVLRHYLTIVGIYATIGTLIGLILGILGGYLLVTYLSNLLTLDIGPLAVFPFLLIESITIGIGTPLVAAALPVYLGTRIPVHQALSGYGLENATRVGSKMRMPISTLDFLPQTIQFAVRNLFRKRTRALLTLVTLTLCGTVFLAVQTTSYSVDVFLAQLFDTYNYTMLASVANPQPYDRLQQVLMTVPGVSQTEPLEQYAVSTKWGVGILTGVQPDTQLYHKQVIAGRWFTNSDQNVVVISQDAADTSGLKVGDTFSLHGITVKATWRIIGIAKDYGGINPGQLGVLLAPISQVNAFIQEPSAFTQSVMVRSTGATISEVNAQASHVDDAMSAAGFQATVMTAQQLKQQEQSEFQILFVLLYTVAVIVALVGVMALFNTLTMSVLERRREIGILRSLGATSRRVAQVFWAEGLSLAVVAWLISLVLGLPAAYGFVLLLDRLLLPLPFAFNLLSLGMMLGVILLVASLASIGPAMSATRVKIAQTLRYE